MMDTATEGATTQFLYFCGLAQRAGWSPVFQSLGFCIHPRITFRKSINLARTDSIAAIRSTMIKMDSNTRKGVARA
jgi:hypothetical protein